MRPLATSRTWTRTVSSRTNNITRLQLHRRFTSGPSRPRQLKTDAEIDDFLSKPTWSVETLLPTEEQIHDTSEITPKQLNHLLRLSALEAPATEEEQRKLLKDLKAQLHFVREIQKVDVTGVEPLQSIRDESARAEQESQIDLSTLKDALAQEETVGTYHKRIKRKSMDSAVSKEVENWDVLGQAPQKVGRYFVVHGEGEGGG